MTNLALDYAKALQDRFNAEGIADKSEYGSYWEHLFTVEEGRKYDRIVHSRDIVNPAQGQTFNPYQRFVFAFVERATGRLIKADGWSKPAKWGNDLASKYNLTTDFTKAVEEADTVGGFLYR